MLSTNARFVDDWWSELFGVTGVDLWDATTVRRHGLLADYTGWLVAWRHDGVHVSAPASADDATLERLASTDVEALSTQGFWSTFADSVSGRLIGPATHHYLDVDPGADPAVAQVEPVEAEQLRPLVSDEEWWEAGFQDDVTHAFVLREEDDVVAVANLSGWADEPRDIGVLVLPDARGRQLVDRIGRTAASYAVREHAVARWVARNANTGSVSAARRLGFEPWCTQLAIRVTS